VPSEAQLANLSPDAAIKHGVKMADGVLMACRKCCLRERCPECRQDGGDCPMEAAYLSERGQALASVPHLDPAIDGPAVRMLLWAELRLLRWARYTAAAGETLPGAPAYLESHPAEKTIGTLFNTWSRLLAALSITPATRRALEGQGKAGPAAQIAEAIKQIANEKPGDREPAIDADFEATDEEVVGNGA